MNKIVSASFLDKKRKKDVTVTPFTEKAFPGWLKKAPAAIRNAAAEKAYSCQPGKIMVIPDAKGNVGSILLGLNSPVSMYDVASLVAALRQNYSASFLKSASFTLNLSGLKQVDIDNVHIGWALANYEFTAYKKSQDKFPALVWDKRANKKRIKATLEAMFLIRDLVNTPSNDMGPEEIEKATRKVAGKSTVTVIKDGALLTKNFPMIYTVGMGSPRRPRLIEFKWGKPGDPKLTLVGKGVAFDTGGLNIKPTSYMALMKKDMGGAAHVLGLAHMIMSLKLPVRLRVIIAAVENSVDGHSFRPGDVLQSRKGLTVENTNTDAEGRLILGDALAYGTEDKPDLIIDYATLTGSARAALGPDIPAMFSNNDALAEKLKKISFTVEDPLWQMPLWRSYQMHNSSQIADMQNSSGVPGDLMYSALFLEKFLNGKPDWLHIDTYAWEHTGKPGRPRGGADLGMRAVYAMLEEKYK